MTSLQQLTHEAAQLALGRTFNANETEADRVMTVCNACRYCEGFCAVFPAMTRRLAFNKADLHYFANLCHNCGACLHACQYAAPHAFSINVPVTLARVRKDTYAQYAWPRVFGGLYERNGLAITLALVASLALFLTLAIAKQGALFTLPSGANFYAIFPHGLMVSMFLPIFAFACVAITMSIRAFWYETAPQVLSSETQSTAGARAEAAHNALTLKYLDGGHGEGCNDEDDRFTHRRRVFHHFTFYGFALCFAATSVATLYHYAFNWPAPYGLLSVPKLLGLTGGIAMVIGTSGLLWLRARRHPAHRDAGQSPMDVGFIAILFLVATTGLLLVPAKGTTALPITLAVHLATVMAFFLLMPYSKFAHGFFRGAALVKYSIEKRLPNRVTGAGE
jgi:citrate/tricarballylate utilization protein